MIPIGLYCIKRIQNIFSDIYCEYFSHSDRVKRQKKRRVDSTINKRQMFYFHKVVLCIFRNWSTWKLKSETWSSRIVWPERSSSLLLQRDSSHHAGKAFAKRLLGNSDRKTNCTESFCVHAWRFLENHTATHWIPKKQLLFLFNLSAVGYPRRLIQQHTNKKFPCIFQGHPWKRPSPSRPFE